MQKMIMLLLTLGLAACAPANDHKIQVYKLVTSTCGHPATDLIMSGIINEVTNTSLQITQIGSKTCSFYLTGVMENNALSLTSGKVTSGEGCHINDLIFEDHYTVSTGSNTLTFTSDSCINVYELK